MVTRPESRIVPFDFDTKLLCEMNIEPDKFLWKFYPLNSRDAFNPKAVINLSSTNFVNIPVDKNPAKKKQSDLTIQVNYLFTRSIRFGKSYFSMFCKSRSYGLVLIIFNY